MKRVILMFVFAVFLFSFASAQEVNETNSTTNETNMTLPMPPINLLGISPTSFKVGDVQFSLQVQNTGNETLMNLAPLISGRGYATYEVVPLSELRVGERGYILVRGLFREEGVVSLSVNVASESFEVNVSVVSVNAPVNQSQIEEEKKVRLQFVASLTKELDELKNNYTILENELEAKQDDYDVSDVNLEDAKDYLRNAEIALLSEDTLETQIQLRLARDELASQKRKLDVVEKISFVTRIKDNAVLFSTIAGALITFFAVYELLKRKSEPIVHKVEGVIKRKKVEE